jgi:membrane protein
VLDLGNMALALGLLVLGLALTYRFGPNRPDHIEVRLFTRGLLVAMVLWFAVSRGFVLYLANFNSYNQVYGSIGAVVILMMWLYFSAYAVLLGAAVDAEAANVPEPGLPPAPDQ